MKPAQIVRDLVGAAQQLGFRVRYDTGNFRGGACTLDEEEWIVLNRRHPVEVHLSLLADALRRTSIDALYLRPAVRTALEDAWAGTPVDDELQEEEERLDG